MSSETFDLTAPELTPEDLLVLDDPRFGPGTVALVAGAASGIGRAMAVALAANGLTVVGADVDEDGLGDTADRVVEFDAPGRFEGVPTDLTEEADVEAVVTAAAEEGQLRYVANVAGMQHIAGIDEFPTAKCDLLTDVMLRAPFLVAKHGLHGLTRAIAAEGEGTLRGFSVSVGYVLTPLMVDQIEDTAAERGISEQEVVEDVMLGQARTKEMIAPADVANLFTFGFSSYGKHLNGGDLLFDGGYTQTYE